MSTNHDKKKQEEPAEFLKPDPETLHTTDPQEHMKGPVSSSVKTVEKGVEEGNKESKQEADEKKEKNI